MGVTTTGPANANAPYIEFKDVSKAFGKLEVLKDVSFDVLPGEMVCILGRSGVGKSVALHHIMGFLKPDGGRVIVAGEDITDYDEVRLEGIRKKVTMVFQNGALFDSLSVGENVAFPLREKGEPHRVLVLAEPGPLLAVDRIGPGGLEVVGGNKNLLHDVLDLLHGRRFCPVLVAQNLDGLGR